MGKGHEIRCFDYVNHPYEAVRGALGTNALEVFRNATTVAASRARAVASDLRVNVGSLEVATEIVIAVTGHEERQAGPKTSASTLLRLEWEAAKAPRLFPLMRAELSIYPLTSTETQLDFAGRYAVPMGLVGDAIDALVGHRIAEASVHRFVSDVAEYLRRTLA